MKNQLKVDSKQHKAKPMKRRGGETEGIPTVNYGEDGSLAVGTAETGWSPDRRVLGRQRRAAISWRRRAPQGAWSFRRRTSSASGPRCWRAPAAGYWELAKAAALQWLSGQAVSMWERDLHRPNSLACLRWKLDRPQHWLWIGVRDKNPVWKLGFRY